MKFHIENDILTIKLEGAEQFWSVKRRLVVPKNKIVQASWQEVLTMMRRELGFRFGTLIPGFLFAGTFLSGQGRNFLYVQRARGLFGPIQLPHVLILELRDYPYHRLFLTVDKPEIADQIIAWWAGK